tara:strand:- start:1095 stop:1352 length:258 start_codon:yes stop_codon:yes gene_type:complete
MDLNMERYRCKVRYQKLKGRNRHQDIITIFEEGKWYEGYFDTDIYFIDDDDDVNLLNYVFDEEDFHNHFSTEAEVRELEIDKVLS